MMSLSSNLPVNYVVGIDEDLRGRGAKDGDIVRIGKFEFEFVD